MVLVIGADRREVNMIYPHTGGVPDSDGIASGAND